MPNEQRTLYVAQKGKLLPWSIPKRELGGSQVRVEVHSVGINPVDWKTVDYQLADGAGQGNDFAGTIVEIGPDVKTVKVGDTVAGGVGGGDIDKKENGAFTNLLTVDEHLLFKFPYPLVAAKSNKIASGIPRTFEQAASLGIALDTSAIAFEHHKPKGTEWALIYGVTSSLGFTAAQYARNIGYKVIGVSGSLPDVTRKLKGVELLDRHDSQWPQMAKELSNDSITFALDAIALGSSKEEVLAACPSHIQTLLAISDPGSVPSEQILQKHQNVKLAFPLYFFMMQDVKKFGPQEILDKEGIIERADKLIEDINNQLANEQIESLPIRILQGFTELNEAMALNRNGIRGEKVVVRV